MNNSTLNFRSSFHYLLIFYLHIHLFIYLTPHLFSFFYSDNIDYIVDECCARMRASCSETHTQQHSHSTHEDKNANYGYNQNEEENYDNNYSNKNSKFNKLENFENRVFQCDENRPEHSHGILDFVFTKLGQEAFSPTTTSFSTSSSLSVSRKNNSTPISILKGMKLLFLP